jgi:hypothetical protein
MGARPNHAQDREWIQSTGMNSSVLRLVWQGEGVSIKLLLDEMENICSIYCVATEHTTAHSNNVYTEQTQVLGVHTMHTDVFKVVEF